MGQLVGCLDGIGQAARALDFPIVSGNVSLYNETMGSGILPTPAIGGVGVVADVAKIATLAFKRAGEDIWLIGGAPTWLGRSAYLAVMQGKEDGAPPPVDLTAEKRHGAFVAGLIAEGGVTAVHDLSDGGLAVAIAEMAIKGGLGAALFAPPADAIAHAYFFGEDQARYVVTAPKSARDVMRAAAAKAGALIDLIGETGGAALSLPGEKPLPVSELQEVYESWLPRYMGAAA